MKTKFKIFIFIIVLSLFKSVNAQTNTAPFSGEIRRGDITLSNGVKFKFKSMTYRNDSLFFLKNGTSEKLPLSEIYTIRKTRSSFFEYLAYGLGAGLGAGAGLYSEYDDPGMLVGFALGGAAFGGLLGLAFTKHTIIYYNPKLVN